MTIAKKSSESVYNKLKIYFLRKLSEGYQLKSKEDAIKLRKKAIEELQLDYKKHLWYSKEILDKVIKEKNIEIVGQIDKAKTGTVDFGLKKEEVKAETVFPQPKPTYVGSGPPVVPSGPMQSVAPIPTSIGSGAPGEIIPQIAKLPPERKEEYEHLFEKGFGFVAKTYIKLGLIEGATEEEEKPMSIEEFQKDAGDLGKDWADYCFRHNIELPKFIELFMLGAYSFFVFGGPILNTFMFGKKKKEIPEDDQLKTIDSKKDTQAKKQEVTT